MFFDVENTNDVEISDEVVGDDDLEEISEIVDIITEEDYN